MSTYDALYRLHTLVQKDASGNLLASYSYTRTLDGQINGVTEQVKQADGIMPTDTIHYIYDGLDRLAEEAFTSTQAGQNYTADYTLDLVGNRLTKQTSNADGSVDRTTSIYNQRDELTGDTTTHNGVVQSTVTYQYDQNGSLTVQQSSTSDETDYWYDVKGLLAGATVRQTQGGVLVVEQTQFAYDPDGIRAREDVTTTTGSNAPSTATTLYVLDQNNPTDYTQVIEERTGSGLLAVSYVYGLAPLSQFRGGQSQEFLLDGHSGVRQLIAAGGTIAASYRYDGFGTTLAADGSAQTVVLYRGERFDPVLQQYYLRARFYDPAIGRFTSTDPSLGSASSPGTLERYVYGANNPVNMADPTGRDALGVTVGLGLSISLQLPAVVKGSLITLALSTFGRAGSDLRNKGLELVAAGEVDAGFLLYDLGGQIFGLGDLLIQTSATAVDVFQVALAGIQIIRGVGRFVGSGGLSKLASIVRNLLRSTRSVSSAVSGTGRLRGSILTQEQLELILQRRV